MTDTFSATVIPAKAGIQIIDQPHAVGQPHQHGFVRCAEFYDKLDSGLRRNDEVAGFAYCLQLCKAHSQKINAAYKETQMQFFYLVLGGLATYRLSLLVSKEDGPAYIFRKLRKMTPSPSIREGLSCEWCMSIWAGALVAAYYWWLEIISGAEWPLYWLAMSALGIICNQQWTSKKKLIISTETTENQPQPPKQTEKGF